MPGCLSALPGGTHREQARPGLDQQVEDDGGGARRQSGREREPFGSEQPQGGVDEPEHDDVRPEAACRPVGVGGQRPEHDREEGTEPPDAHGEPDDLRAPHRDCRGERRRHRVRADGGPEEGRATVRTGEEPEDDDEQRDGHDPVGVAPPRDDARRSGERRLPERHRDVPRPGGDGRPDGDGCDGPCAPGRAPPREPDRQRADRHRDGADPERRCHSRDYARRPRRSVGILLPNPRLSAHDE